VTAGQVSGALLLILAGMWLLLNAITGDLAGRLWSYRKAATK
jgi:hypothetical protein